MESSKPTRQYDFDTVHDRSGSYSLKWDFYKGTDVQPLWVADMDFQTAPEIVSVLERYITAGIYGYTNCPERLPELLVERMKRLYGWETQPEEYLFFSGVVPAMAQICRVFGRPNGKVVNMTPVYYPFLALPDGAGMSAINVPFTKHGSKWELDFDALEAVAQGADLIQLSSPHNPLGKMFTREELERIADICLRQNVLMVSDEIHCDLILNKERKHIPTASLSPEVSSRTFTLMSPTKTWGIPGLQVSYMIVQNPELRATMQKSMAGLFGRLSGPAYFSAVAAYEHGQPWLSALLDYLRDNRDLVFQKLKGLPGIELCEPLDATYLAWFDYKATGCPNLKEVLEQKARAGLSDGKAFGYDGALRLNFACPRLLLSGALDRIAATIKSL